MKKITMILLSLLSALYMSADDGLSISAFEVEPGATKTVSVVMNNTEVVAGFQFDIALPAGITLTNAKLAGSRTTFNYTLKQKKQADGSIRLLCMAESDQAVFSGTTGEVLQLTLAIADDAKDGKVDITLKNQYLTIVNGEAFDEYAATATTTAVTIQGPYILGDANNSGTVNVADITAVVSYMYGSPPANFNFKAADVNNSGTINVADITGIVSIMYGGGNANTSNSKER